MSGGVHRQHPMMVNKYTIPKGQTCLRSTARSVRKDVERQMVAHLGRALTRKEKDQAKKLAGECIAARATTSIGPILNTAPDRIATSGSAEVGVKP
jgi:hypothetical protein